MSSIPTLKIGVSGVRGIAGKSLTPQIITSFAAAFGTLCGRRPVVVGTDTRPSREMVAPAVMAGLLSVGCIPVNIGVVPVPTLQFHIRRIGAAGGICVTASHNPMEWNALKFCGSDGVTLRPNQFSELTDLYHQGVFPRVSFDEIPRTEQDRTAVEGHLKRVLQELDVDSIRQCNFNVAVDCCNGAGFEAAPRFLRALGCRVTEIHTTAGADFPRDPEPLRQNLDDLADAVRSGGAAVGFALDADADRLAILDESGASLGEDSTIALAAHHHLCRRPGPVVVNLTTSRMIEEVASEHQVPLHRTPVGEVNVLEKMFQVEASIGGEGNGGVILSSVNACRDSFVAMGLILESLACSRKSIGALRKELPVYAIVKEKVPCRSRDIAAFIRLLRYRFRGEKVDLRDGIKVDWPDRWLHVRGSNTEPILRLVAEGATEADARDLIDEVMEYLRPVGA